LTGMPIIKTETLVWPNGSELSPIVPTTT